VSFNVLAIAEDSSSNGYILLPLLRALFKSVGKPHAKISIPTDYRIQGYDAALRYLKSEEFYNRAQGFNLSLFLPDADRADEQTLSQLRLAAANKGVSLLTCAAEPESEIWILAGLADFNNPSDWSAMRQHNKLKEEVFLPYSKQRGLAGDVGAGRRLLMEESVKDLNCILTICKELCGLKSRICEFLQQHPGL
jgi:hypothetical protein